jgi:hypothetical protein
VIPIVVHGQREQRLHDEQSRLPECRGRVLGGRRGQVDARQAVDDQFLVARRIAGIEPQDRLEMAHRLFFDGRPVRLLRPDGSGAGECQRREEEHDLEAGHEWRDYR